MLDLLAALKVAEDDCPARIELESVHAFCLQLPP